MNVGKMRNPPRGNDSSRMLDRRCRLAIVATLLSGPARPNLAVGAAQGESGEQKGRHLRTVPDLHFLVAGAGFEPATFGL